MEATVVGAILSGVLQVGLERLSSKEFINLFRERKDDGELLGRLRRNLLAIIPVLDYAEDRVCVSEYVKEWVFEIQDSVHEACDLVDKVNTEALRRKVETEHQSSAASQHALSSREFVNEMMPEMEKLVLRLERFQQLIPQLDLQLKHEKEKQWYRDPSTSLVEDFVYGRDLEKQKIIQLLLCEDGDTNQDNITVIPLVGLGGIGKTTLAQLVYDDDNVKAHFDTLAWVCISNPYNSMKVTRDLLEELSIPGSDSSQSLNSLQVKLKTGLKHKKFLIVLDDVWTRDYNHWSKLRISLGSGLRGSKIIVTTRDEQVALMVGKRDSIHHLSLISQEASWTLFKKHALENRDGNEDAIDFEEMGKRIVKRCKGLPLAIKTIAGLLRSKTTMEEWESILNSDVWGIATDEDELDILPALRLSYIHLPSILKQCFAYCALFPKGYNFKEKEIVHLWLANDLLEKTKGNKTMEEMGEVYLHELKMRSLLQCSTNNSFRMHDLVNDLAKSIFGRYYHHEDRWKCHGILSGVRHFSYYMDLYDELYRFNLLNGAKGLRTFLPLQVQRFKSLLKLSGDKNCFKLSKKFLYDVLPTFESLRYLSFSGYEIFQLPDAIGNLKQLHHLDLSFTKISSLPDWICTLYNLQSLLLRSCSELKELPLEFGKLIELRYLDITDVPLLKMPTHIGRLKGLQVLTSFVLDDNGATKIEELGNFPNLRKKLAISGLENVSDSKDAILAKMKKKKHLKKLILKWNYGLDISPLATDVLNNLEPHPSIKHLEIHGYCGTRFPSWLSLNSSVLHLVHLSLKGCENCFQLPAVGQLVSLKTLEIVGLNRIITMDTEMYGDIDCGIRPFQSLKVLRIENMAEWKTWFIPDCEVFTSLEELYIISCPELIGNFPRQLLSLRKLEISSCEKLVSNGHLSIFNPTQGVLIQRFPSLVDLNISLPNLEGLSSELEELTSLQDLLLEYCIELSPLPPSSIPASLKTLQFVHFCNLQLETGSSLIPSNSSLETLNLFWCDNLKVLPLGLFPRLKTLQIFFSKNIELLLVPPGNDFLTSLQTLCIWKPCNLFSFPAGGLPAPNLRNFELLECKNLKSLPNHMRSLLSSLEYLEILGCSEIECFPEGGLPFSLQTLCVCNCNKLVANRSQWGLEGLHSLVKCEIKGTVEEESLLEDLMLPLSLEILSLGDHRSLKTLSHGDLQYLTSLKTLRILDCPLLPSLPEEGVPSSLSHLEISNCPLLKPRLEWQKGEDWPKVEHIPCIIMDQELVP